MFAVSRRSFLEKLSLGVGSLLLAPIAESLISQAHGQEPSRKRAVFSLVGAGIHWDLNFMPEDLRSLGPETPILPGTKTFQWPEMVAPLAKYRDRMLLIDGLGNRHKVDNGNHSSGYQALSNFQSLDGVRDEEGGPPGNVTIDQYIANATGASNWRKTVLFGASTAQEPQKLHTFASGPRKPEPLYQSPLAMFQDVFGPLAGGADSNASRTQAKQRILLDSIRTDINRLQSHLAPPERRGLDHYLAAIEEFEKRQGALAAASCNAPTAPILDATMGTVEDRLESMNEMAILAMVCGLTNVVGIAMGCGDSHRYFPTFRRISIGTEFEEKGVGETGHESPEVHRKCQGLVHAFNCGLLARTADALSAIPEGDHNMFDNSVMVYLSDNGEEHHAQYYRWPLVVVGTAGGKLRADGRFLRYPSKGAAGGHSTADLFCSIATACGAPTNDFGKGGNEEVQGPLAELMI